MSHLLNVGLAISLADGTVRHQLQSESLKALVHWSLGIGASAFSQLFGTMRSPHKSLSLFGDMCYPIIMANSQHLQMNRMNPLAGE